MEGKAASKEMKTTLAAQYWAGSQGTMAVGRQSTGTECRTLHTNRAAHGTARLSKVHFGREEFCASREGTELVEWKGNKRDLELHGCVSAVGCSSSTPA